ncbi:MAG: MATE family efflux transporter [Firmicutes bacterium]|nr:MATE family efflux transporter [Bacillota bacterium]
MGEAEANRKTIINDFTSGNIPKQLLTFSIPFMMSNALQVLYSLVDMMVVGKFIGSRGLAAVSIASQLFIFMTMLGLGFANGGQVLVAQYIGAKQHDRMKRAIGTLFSLLMGMGLLMTVIGLGCGKNILTLLNTPAEAYGMAWDYTFICSLGIVFTYGYNMVAAVLRGLGDSKHPFLFVAIASVLNLIGDLLFIGVWEWGTKGAALATILGQAISFIFSLCFLYKRKEELGFDFKKESLGIDPEISGLLVKLGIPFAVQSCAINVSMMFVNSLVNKFGVYAAAVFGVGIKIDDIINKTTQGMAFANSTMCAQNLAAGHYKRTRKTVYMTLLYCSLCYLIFTVIYLTKYRQMFGIFTDDPNVLELSFTFVSAIVWSFPAMTLMRGSHGFIRGLGNAKLSLALGLLDAFVLRIGLSYLLGVIFNLGLFGFFLGYGLAAYGTGVPGMIYFLSGKWKNFRLIKETPGVCES